ncbi:hypothetical protein E4U21_001299 [Claviceps maximensis]|nr:hypothetical protein E4U21_001299 [Claviceps maximensis]
MSTLCHYWVDEEGVYYVTPCNCQDPFIAHGVAYLEVARRAYEAYLSSISHHFFLNGQEPIYMVSPEYSLPALLPEIPYWHPELGAINGETREALQITPFVSHEEAYFEVARIPYEAPLSRVPELVFLNGREPNPIVSLEQNVPAPLPAISNWHPELGAINGETREALQTTPFASYEEAYFEAARRPHEAPPSRVPEPVFLTGREPNPIVSLEQNVPAPLPAVSNWNPDLEAINETAREALRTNGIKHYLVSLQQHNFNLSPKRWSEFTDNDPEDVDTHGQYRPITLQMRDFMDESCLMKCDRCGTLCDVDFNVVEDDGDNTADRIAYVLPYTHCPLKSLSQCYSKTQDKWIKRQKRFNDVYRLRLCRNLERFLLREPAVKIRADAFEETCLEPTTREIFNAYRGLRVFWIRLLVSRQESPDIFNDPGDDEYIDGLPLWGELMTDATLVQRGLIAEKHIDFLYGISSRGADYLYRWQSEWEREVLWLNTYAGLARHRYLQSDHPPHWRKSAENLGIVLDYLVDAEENLANAEEQEHVKVQAYQEARIQARAMFRELHSLLMRADSTLVAF